ncbi:multidrug resistance-associated protein 1-like [Centruroides vittatus]|uniref:multidrug resistance-associated protein 1-like n=1 Tax=Centruroides vittatus TaxID=120091 RepID=UPI00350F789A
MASSALEVFCGSTFWDSQLTWNTSSPEFTPCFQKTVLVWMPCGFLWLFAPLETYYLLKSSARNIPWTWLSISKIIIICFLCILCLGDLAYSSIQTLHYLKNVPSADYYVSFIRLVSFLLVLGFIVAGRIRGIQSSGILFIFWTFLTITELGTYIPKISHALHNDKIIEVPPFVIFMLYYPLVACMFILSWFADARPEYQEKWRFTKKECPEKQSSFPSKLLYWWFNRLVLIGWKRNLTEADLWSLNEEDLTENVAPVFDKYWHEELLKHEIYIRSASYSPKRSNEEVQIRSERKSKPSIVKALIKTFGPYFLSGAIFKLFHDLLQFASPLLLRSLIAFVTSNDPVWKGILYAVIIFITATLQSLMLGVYFHRMYIIGMRIRTALISSIYRKSLVLSNFSRRESTVGEIVNLMSVDAQRFMDLMVFINMLWSAPLQIILALFFLWDVLGVSVLTGVVVMILVIPLNGYAANVSKKLQVKQMKKKDERVKLMNEILGGIKVLKLYAWENSFLQQVLDIRNKEIQHLRRMAYLHSVTAFIWTCAPFVVSLTSFATFVMISEHNILDAKKAFVALTLFHILRFPLTMLPMLISMIVQATVSVKRLNKFLTNEELEQYVTHDKYEINPIVIEHGTFSWSKDESAILKEININIPEGSLVAVVGQVGSGKSSLLSAMLGDMDKLEGRVNIKGNIAYVAQQAWIQNATLRDNILFHHAMNHEKYNQVIKACALETDLTILPGGDMTEIGERGINLSGGQKQRVSIARAVYSNSDIYLLDDPLSAVDSHVSKQIFEEAIGPKGILKDKTRVLVTHSITYLTQMDMIIVMKDGEIHELGSYSELLNKKGAFAEFLLQYLREETEDIDKLDASEVELMEEIMMKVGTPNLESQLSRTSVDGDIAERRALLRSLSSQMSQDSTSSNRSSPLRRLTDSKSKLDDIKDEKLANGQVDPSKLIQTETMETGKVKWEIYLYYFKSVGYVWMCSVVLGYVGLQGFTVGSNIWLSVWSNDKPTVNGTQDIKLRDLRLGVYGAFGIGEAFSIILGSVALALGSMKASTLLHYNLLSNILHCPMSFFETVPLGRIVNRFAKDIDTMDLNIPMNFRSWLLCFLQVIATILVISFETPIFLGVIVPIGFLYYFIQKFYISTSRQLKRLESVTRSPIYSHFSETLSGVNTIRAYNAQNKFLQISNEFVDTNHCCFYPSNVSNRWLAIRLEFCGNCIVFFAALFAVMGRDDLNPGSVGLSVSYALSITATLNWLVRMSSELETNIVSVERMAEYTLAEKEAEWEIENSRPPLSWPTNGEVVFDRYSTRYRQGLNLVLKGISCEIKSGEKVGIVGRTGAGKSSLTLSLFRIIEGASGSIIIDGVDISKIGLHDLRSKLTIIPQDPVLFSGTLRMNLDPFNKYSDEEVWIALEHSHLKIYVSSLESGLQHMISEGGENLSVGQRQLVCLARALLRKTKVLILDEATAAIDLETDALIQTTIRTEFAGCTILTIAHRLNTIMDYDRVLVLDQGIIKEFDNPENLLQNKESLFYGMAKDARLV